MELEKLKRCWNGVVLIDDGVDVQDRAWVCRHHPLDAFTKSAKGGKER